MALIPFFFSRDTPSLGGGASGTLWSDSSEQGARTHGSEDVAGDVVPGQLQPPQGSVAGETAHQGPAAQEADVIPAQVWEETSSPGEPAWPGCFLWGITNRQEPSVAPPAS